MCVHIVQKWSAMFSASFRTSVTYAINSKGETLYSLQAELVFSKSWKRCKEGDLAVFPNA